MSSPYIGEIRMFAGNFAPVGWALCHGQLIQVSQNNALFSLLGTIYGGDGRTTFGIPDMRGRIPIHHGSGPGLTPRNIGNKGGAETHTLTVAELPPHNHPLQASNALASSVDPVNKHLAVTNEVLYRESGGLLNSMNGQIIGAAGGSGSHANIQPFQCINFIISLIGTYPSRT